MGWFSAHAMLRFFRAEKSIFNMELCDCQDWVFLFIYIGHYIGHLWHVSFLMSWLDFESLLFCFVWVHNHLYHLYSFVIVYHMQYLPCSCSSTKHTATSAAVSWSCGTLYAYGERMKEGCRPWARFSQTSGLCHWMRRSFTLLLAGIFILYFELLLNELD